MKDPSVSRTLVGLLGLSSAQDAGVDLPGWGGKSPSSHPPKVAASKKNLRRKRNKIARKSRKKNRK